MKGILTIVIFISTFLVSAQDIGKISTCLLYNNLDIEVPTLLIGLSPNNKILDGETLKDFLNYADSLKYTKVVILFKDIRYHEIDSIFPLHYGIPKPAFPIIISDSLFKMISYQGESFACFIKDDTVLVRDFDAMQDAYNFIIELVQKEKLIRTDYVFHKVNASGLSTFSTPYYNNSNLYLIDVLSNRILHLNLLDSTQRIDKINYSYKDVFFTLYQGCKYFRIDEKSFTRGEMNLDVQPHHIAYNSAYTDSNIYLMMYYRYGIFEKNRFPLIIPNADTVYSIFSIKVLGIFDGNEIKYLGLPINGFPEKTGGNNNFIINIIGEIDSNHYLFSTYGLPYNVNPDSSYYMSVFKRTDDTLRFSQFLPNVLPDTAIASGNNYTHILGKGFKYKDSIYFYIKGSGDCYVVTKESNGFGSRLVKTSFINNEYSSAGIEHIAETNSGGLAVLRHRENDYILNIYKTLDGAIERTITLPAYFSSNARFFLTPNKLIAVKYDDYYIKYAMFEY